MAAGLSRGGRAKRGEEGGGEGRLDSYWPTED